MTAELWALAWSPPSERARWALRARGVPFEEVRYIPSTHMSLRLVSATGKASVPVLFADTEIVPDSTAIARWADERGTRGPPLFPKGADAEIAAWTAIADELFARSRVIFGPGFGRDREALRAMIDPAPAWASALFPIAWRFAGWSFVQRYDLGSEELEAANAKLREVLVAAEAKRAGRLHLVGDALTYADVSLAVLLSGLRPPPRDLYPMPPAVARLFTTVPEPGPWDALFAWRDEIWRHHKP